MQRNENDFSCCEIGLECRFLHLLHLLLAIHCKKYSADLLFLRQLDHGRQLLLSSGSYCSQTAA